MRKIELVKIGLVFALCCSSLATRALEVSPADGRGVKYLSGGVGDEELAAIASANQAYSLKLLFAEKSGAYITNVKVSIVDKHGRIYLSNVDSGPYLLVNLAPATYKVTATYSGYSQEMAVTIKSGRQLSKILRW